MKAIRTLATLAAAAMLAVAFAPVRANAQGVVRGTFKLSSQAHWGSASLAPGTYRFEVFGPEDAGNVVREVMVWSRTKETRPMYILGQIDGGASPAEDNSLLCRYRGPVCIVRTLQLGVAGETLTFTAPKSERIERAARGRKNHTRRIQTADAIETVPIDISGK